MCARIMSIFSFPTHTRAHFARQITKDYKMFSMWLQNKNKLKHITHYAIFQNRRICASCLIVWLGALCSSCILPYINGLRSALVGVAYQAVLCVLGLYGRLRERERESVSVFDGLVYL